MSIVPYAAFVDDFALHHNAIHHGFHSTLCKTNVFTPPTATVPPDLCRPHAPVADDPIKPFRRPTTLHAPPQLHSTANHPHHHGTPARKPSDGISKQNYTSTASDAGVPPANLNREEAQVDKLVDSATLIVQGIWPASNPSPPPESPSQHGVQSPPPLLSLRSFIKETLKRSKTSHSTLHVALYYLILLHQRLLQHGISGLPVPPSSASSLNCGRRMFLSALILASKYLQDRNFSARAWSKISGLGVAEINMNETTFLLAIDWKLHIPEPVFRRWSRVVLDFARCPREATALLHAAGAEFVHGHHGAAAAALEGERAADRAARQAAAAAEAAAKAVVAAGGHEVRLPHIGSVQHGPELHGDDGFTKLFEFRITVPAHGGKADLHALPASLGMEWVRGSSGANVGFATSGSVSGAAGAHHSLPSSASAHASSVFTLGSASGLSASLPSGPAGSGSSPI